MIDFADLDLDRKVGMNDFLAFMKNGKKILNLKTHTFTEKKPKEIISRLRNKLFDKINLISN